MVAAFSPVAMEHPFAGATQKTSGLSWIQVQPAWEVEFEFTLSVAAVLVAEPAVLLTTTSKVEPLSEVEVAGVV